jgi:RNase H-like domain found in reverse transcriptase/Reverse transcriptase (RNA-dependent DNA polymerase)/Integrase zinc binding domain/Chromo (CHRromatin Organisation MOdifier) domain/Retroviral aspartyl protease
MLGVEFTLDCNCNELGTNSLCPLFCSPHGQDYFHTDLSGQVSWIVPNTHEVARAFEHYMYYKRHAPVNTSACFIVPKWPGVSDMFQRAGFESVKEYARGTQLFSCKDARSSAISQQGIACPYVVWYDAPKERVALRCMGMDSKETHIMTFHGRVASEHAKIMLDSGAYCAGSAQGFVSQEFATKHALAICKATVPWVNLASGANSPVIGEVQTTLRIDAFKQKRIKLLVIPEGVSGVDVILATDWLRANKATMCWDTNTVTLRSANAHTVLTPHTYKSVAKENTSLHFTTALLHAVSTPDMISAKQAAKLMQQGARSLMLVVRPDSNIVAKQAASIQLNATSVEEAPHLVADKDIKALLDKYARVFEELGHFDSLPKLKGTTGEHLIPLIPGEQYTGSKRMYRLSPKELEELKKQVAQLLATGWIEPANSPFGAPVLFVEKPHQPGALRMCIDLRAINQITVKDRYPMPNVQDIFDQLQGATVFSTLDLQSGYYQIRISEEDRPKTAFLTPMGQFQFKVMCFGLSNAPATFQKIMHSLFGQRIGKHVMVYLDDIIVFSKSADEHLQHLEDTLSVLQEHDFKAKLSKCQFNKPELKFLGHVVGRHGLKVDPEKVATVQKWPQPSNTKELRRFLGLSNYFRRFIKDYSSIAAPLTRLTGSQSKFEWTLACQEAFEMIKFALTNAPVLALPNPTRPYVVWSDASIVGSGAVLIQDEKPVAYTSRKFSPAEAAFSTTDQECLGIVTALKDWRCYLEGAVGLDVYTDHHPLTYLQSQKRNNMLSRRQARWMEDLTRFNFNIIYKKGKTNIADPLSRVYESPLLLSAISVSVSNKIKDMLRRAYSEQFKEMAERRHYQLVGEIYYNDKGQVMVPESEDLRKHIIAQYHDEAIGGHRGVKRTLEAVTRTFAWYGVAKDVAQYVASCPSCQRNKSSTSKPGGLLQPLPIPTRPWGSVSLDFIGPLPETAQGHNAILVFVDRLTKMARLCATTITCSAKEVANLFIARVFANGHGLPDNFVSDRDGRFTSHFWKELTSILEIKLKMSTAYHPQTDGQTERMNRLVEETLRHYVNPTQSDWDEHLPLVEFAINDSKNASIGTTPFKLNYVWDVRLPPNVGLWDRCYEKYESSDRNSRCPAAADYAKEMAGRLKRAKQLLSAAQSRQKQQADKKRKDVGYKAGGDWVMLDTRNLKFKGPQPDDTKKSRGKLMPRFIGPYRIKALHGRAAVELEFPADMKGIHPVFHVSLVKPYIARAGTHPTAAPPPPILMDGEKYYEVDRIVNHRLVKKGKKTTREFQVAWKGYDSDHNTWEKELELREQEKVAKEMDAYLRRLNLPKSV